MPKEHRHKPRARRRDILRYAGGAVLAAGVAGCLDETLDDSEGADGNDGFEPKTRLGRGDSVEVRGSAEREFEFINGDENGDTDDRRIRVVYGSGMTDEREFGDWSEGVCRSVGADELAQILRDEFEDDIGVGSGRVREEMFELYDGDEADLREALGDRTHTIYVYHTTVRDVERTREPDVTYDRLVEATPRSLSITAVFDDHGIERACSYPVVVRREEVQPD